jgi:hypothetical protein
MGQFDFTGFLCSATATRRLEKGLSQRRAGRRKASGCSRLYRAAAGPGWGAPHRYAEAVPMSIQHRAHLIAEAECTKLPVFVGALHDLLLVLATPLSLLLRIRLASNADWVSN